MPPCLAELVTVKEPEDATNEKQDHLVERAGHRSEAESAAPSNRSRNPTVPNHDLDSADCSNEESTPRPHAVSPRKRWRLRRLLHDQDRRLVGVVVATTDNAQRLAAQRDQMTWGR
jgi:hypothetical protein